MPLEALEPSEHAEPLQTTELSEPSHLPESLQHVQPSEPLEAHLPPEPVHPSQIPLPLDPLESWEPPELSEPPENSEVSENPEAPLPPEPVQPSQVPLPPDLPESPEPPEFSEAPLPPEPLLPSQIPLPPDLPESLEALESLEIPLPPEPILPSQIPLPPDPLESQEVPEISQTEEFWESSDVPLPPEPLLACRIPLPQEETPELLESSEVPLPPEPLLPSQIPLPPDLEESAEPPEPLEPSQIPLPPDPPEHVGKVAHLWHPSEPGPEYDLPGPSTFEVIPERSGEPSFYLNVDFGAPDGSRLAALVRIVAIYETRVASLYGLTFVYIDGATRTFLAGRGFADSRPHRGTIVEHSASIDGPGGERIVDIQISQRDKSFKGCVRKLKVCASRHQTLGNSGLDLYLANMFVRCEQIVTAFWTLSLVETGTLIRILSLSKLILPPGALSLASLHKSE